MPLLEPVSSSKKRKSEVSSIYRVTKHRKKPSHSRTKRKSLYWDPGGTLEKIKQPKHLFSRNEDHCISKEVKGNALASKSKSCRPETITVENQYGCHDLSVCNNRQNVFLQSVIYPSEKNSFEQAFWHEVKVVCYLPTPFLHLNDFFI